MNYQANETKGYNGNVRPSYFKEKFGMYARKTKPTFYIRF